MEKDNGGKDGEEEAGGGWQWETDDIRELKISLRGEWRNSVGADKD